MIMRRALGTILSIFMLVAMMGLFSINSAFAETISEIDVTGLKRIEKTTVRSYLTIDEGDQFNASDLNQSIKSLYATGFFSDISVKQEGSKLTISVIENPIVNEIAFEGNDQIDDDALRAEIRLRPRVVYTRSKVQEDVDRITQVYRRSGLFAISVEPKVIMLSQNRLNVVFEVDEGPKSKIRNITFVGNEYYSDTRLKEEILTKESRWYRFLTSTDTYDEDRISFDKELLRRFYLSQGYAEFKVESAVAELSSNKEDFFITITINEGERYRFGEIGFENNLEDLETDALVDLTTGVKGEWYDADWVEDTTLKLTNRAANLQYGFVEINPDIALDRDNKLVNLTYVINESPRVFVERININGNVRTLDRVIRREMLLVEGDPYNLDKLKRSEQNIRDLNFFGNVDVKTSRGSRPDLAQIDVTVEEMSTGELSIGAGFSTLDGPLADLRIRERNFMGKGQSLLFATTIAGEAQEYDISFTEPYFMGRDLRLGFDLFRITRDFRDESSFDQARTGGSVRMTYPLAEHLEHLLQYRIENNEVENVEFDASRFIREQEGQRVTSEISHQISYDRRDSKLDPTEGYVLSLSNGLAGLGGDAKYVSTIVRGAVHVPYFNNSVVVTLLSEAGYIYGLSEDIFITERYFIGGQTLRGFDNSGIGPRDVTTGDALGGNRYVRGTAEVSFPIGLPDELGVKGLLFTDAGTLGEIDESDPSIRDDESLRVASGFGISWRSPLGPIKAYLGIPVIKEDYDEERIFQFNFGTSF